jgi:hypothetical protein
MSTFGNKLKQQQHGGGPAGPRRRILRIGVLLGGKIIEERLIRDRSAVSIGQSSKNTFSVPLETLPREWTLFALDHGHNYKLHFGPKMDGRVSDGAQVYTFDQVKGNKAQQHGDHWEMGLSDQARGKVSLGDLTLLFQFVTEPPVQPKPMLPASVRGTLAERIDPRLAVITAISLVIHFGIALAAWLHDRPAKRNTMGARAAQLSVDTYEEVLEPLEPAPTTDATGEETKAEEPAAEKKPDKKPAAEKKPAGGNDGGRKETDATALQEEAARYAAALAADGESEGGVDGAMGKTAPGGDLDKQIKETRESGANVKIGGGGDRGTRGDGDPRTGTGKGPKVEGPGGPTSSKDDKTEKVPKGRIQVASKKGFDDTTLSPDAVLSRIQSVYMSGLKRCQKDLLKSDPTARARVELSFTVNESGRTTSPSAKSDHASLNSCIKGLMAGWTFPAPKDSDGEKTEASFAITLALQPE